MHELFLGRRGDLFPNARCRILSEHRTNEGDPSSSRALLVAEGGLVNCERVPRKMLE